MSVTILSADDPSLDINKHLTHLSELQLQNLTINLGTTGIYVRATVSRRGLMQRTKSRSLIKIFLKQDDVEVPVFFLGKCAEDAQQVAAGDTVVLSGFLIENNTQQAEGQLPCQLMVDPIRTQPKVWILHKKSKSSDQASTSTGRDTKITKQSSTGRNYNYTPLKNIKVGDVINVFGVVKYFKGPSRTRGSDYSMFISIIDNSGAEKLKSSIFAHDEHSLPSVTSVGQVVRFHRLKISEFNGDLQGQGRIGRGFSCLVFSGDIGASLTPKATSNTYTCSEDDLNRVVELREWATDDVLSQLQDGAIPAAPPGVKTRLQDCRVGQYFDLICQVVGKCILENNCCLLKVWDGTYPSFPTKKAEVTEYPQLEWLCLDEDVETDARERVVDIFIFDNHTEKVSGIKPKDYIRLTNLHAAQPKTTTSLNTYTPVELTLHGGGVSYNRDLHLLDDDDSDVMILKEQLLAAGFSDGDSSPRPPSSRNSVPSQSFTQAGGLNQNLGQGQNLDQGHKHGGYCDAADVVPSSFDSDNRCMLTTATVLKSHHNQQPSTLREVVQHTVPHRFRLMVHAKDYLPKPNTPQDLVKLYCAKCHLICSFPVENRDSIDKSPLYYRTDKGVNLYSCAVCKGALPDKVMEYVIMIQFLLHDSTGWITAGLWRQEAEKFCRDVTATDLLLHKDSFNYVKTRLDHLIKPRDGSDLDQPGSTPHIECCIQSYSSAGGVCYQIFDTVLEWSNLD